MCKREDLLKYGKDWNGFIFGGSRRHPCSADSDESSPCCGHWGGRFGKDLETTMKIMRFSAPQGK